MKANKEEEKKKCCFGISYITTSYFNLTCHKLFSGRNLLLQRKMISCLSVA